MMGEPEVVDPEPLSAARLKVQRTNWHKLAGNELMKIQNKIQTDRQKKIKEKWESNRLKNLEVMKQRAEDDAGLSPHPADVIRKYNYKIRPNTQPVRKVIRVGFFHNHLLNESYRAGPLMIAITFMIGTKNDCNHQNREDQI